MVVERSISDCTERAKWSLQKIPTSRWNLRAATST